MTKRTLATLIALFSITATIHAAFRTDTEALQKHSLLKMTDYADLIFTGTVTHKDYIYREGVRHEGGDSATTDIIVRVQTMIKGEPNFGENHVKFMIEGGRFYSERKGALMKLKVNNQPTFAIGENVFLFLAIPVSEKSYHTNYAHGGLHIIYSKFGKKSIKDNTVGFTYIRGKNSPIRITLPVKLALNLSKAYGKSKNAAIALENQIKALALGNTARTLSLPNSMVTQLNNTSKTIINGD